jgi:hypothetical protein
MRFISCAGAAVLGAGVDGAGSCCAESGADIAKTAIAAAPIAKRFIVSYSSLDG